MDASSLLKKWEQHFMRPVARFVSETTMRVGISRVPGNSGSNNHCIYALKISPSPQMSMGRHPSQNSNPSGYPLLV